MKTTLPYILLISSIFLLSCENPDGETPDNFCHCERTLNDLKESFCGAARNPNASEFISDTELFIQFDNENWCVFNSNNYQGLNIAFAISKPDVPDTYKAEANFFNQVFQLMQPESYHDLDLSSDGGFAIETWDSEGTYYSTELGQQEENTEIEINEIIVALNGENHPVKSSISLILSSSNAVTLWNADNTKTISYKLHGEQFYIIY